MGLPAGTVTFLFSDIEGSTRLERSLGSDAWARLIAAHDRIARSAIEGRGGHVVKTEGDSVFAAFADARAAVEAATDVQRALASEPWPDGAAVRVRMGLHTGEGRLRERTSERDPEDYVGIDVNYAARIAAAANGGQVVLSDTLASLVSGHLGDGLGLIDEGPRRVKDFDEPRRLHRLTVHGLSLDARPLRTLDALTNLPAQLTSFIGREREVDEVRALLAESRLVTLTGPGGTGKTRLSLEVAEAMSDTAGDGAWFVELAPIREPALVVGTIAGALGVAEEPDRSIADVLADHLRDREILLILDNFEQIVAAAPTIGDLLRGARGLRCLVSSREALRISGEQEYRVPPLGGTDAVGLFVARARGVRPGFALTDENAAAIHDICARLDSLPLAIELAAARIRLFTPDAILTRLDDSLTFLTSGPRDRSERQQTLRGAIAWSYELLDEPERALFRRLGPLTGGFTIEAAAAVADPDGDLGIDIVDGLASLVDKSLLTEEPTPEGEPRFGRLVTIREYALERLAEAGEAEIVERRHADYFVAFANEAEPNLTAADSEVWMTRIGYEIHNLRAASAFALRVDEPRLGMRLVAPIWRYFHQRNRLHEGRDWLKVLLDHPAGRDDSIERVRALSGAGGVAYWMRDYPASRAYYEERLAIAERLGGDELVSDAHFDLSFHAMIERDLERLRHHSTLSAELAERVGDGGKIALARELAVLTAYLAGDYAEAVRIEEATFRYWEAKGANFRMVDSSILMGALYLKSGDIEQAFDRAARGLRMTAQVEVPSGLVGSFGVIAPIASALGDHVTAARLTGALSTIREATGLSLPSVDVLHLDEPGKAALDALGSEAYGVAYREGKMLSREDAIALALDVERLIGEGSRVAANSD